MLGQGPIYHDIMLIFDNAMTYNNPGDWIHNNALQFKRIVGREKKKMESIIAKTEVQQGMQLSYSSEKTIQKEKHLCQRRLG